MEFPMCPLTDGDLPTINKLLVEFVANNELPFCIVDRPSFHHFVDPLHPLSSTKPPRHTKLKGLASKEASVALQEADKEFAACAKQGHNMVLVSKEHLDGVMAHTGGKAFAVAANSAGSNHNGIATA